MLSSLNIDEQEKGKEPADNLIIDIPSDQTSTTTETNTTPLVLDPPNNQELNYLKKPYETYFHLDKHFEIIFDRQARACLVAKTHHDNSEGFQSILDLENGLFEHMFRKTVLSLRQKHTQFSPTESRCAIELNCGKWQRSKGFHLKAFICPQLYSNIGKEAGFDSSNATIHKDGELKRITATPNNSFDVVECNGMIIKAEAPYLVVRFEDKLLQSLDKLEQLYMWAHESFLNYSGFSITTSFSLSDIQGFEVLFRLDIGDYIHFLDLQAPGKLSNTDKEDLQKFAYKNTPKKYNQVPNNFNARHTRFSRNGFGTIKLWRAIVSNFDSKHDEKEPNKGSSQHMNEEGQPYIKRETEPNDDANDKSNEAIHKRKEQSDRQNFERTSMPSDQSESEQDGKYKKVRYKKVRTHYLHGRHDAINAPRWDHSGFERQHSDEK